MNITEGEGMSNGRSRIAMGFTQLFSRIREDVDFHGAEPKDICFIIDPLIYDISHVKETTDIIATSIPGLCSALFNCYERLRKKLESFITREEGQVYINMMETYHYKVLRGELKVNGNLSDGTKYKGWEAWWNFTNAEVLFDHLDYLGVVSASDSMEGFLMNSLETYGNNRSDSGYQFKRPRGNPHAKMVTIQDYTSARNPMMPELFEGRDKTGKKLQNEMTPNGKMTFYLVQHDSEPDDDLKRFLVYPEVICEKSWGAKQITTGTPRKWKNFIPLGKNGTIPSIQEWFDIREALHEYIKKIFSPGGLSKMDQTNPVDFYKKYMMASNDFNLAIWTNKR